MRDDTAHSTKRQSRLSWRCTIIRSADHEKRRTKTSAKKDVCLAKVRSAQCTSAPRALDLARTTAFAIWPNCSMNRRSTCAGLFRHVCNWTGVPEAMVEDVHLYLLRRGVTRRLARKQRAVLSEHQHARPHLHSRERRRALRPFSSRCRLWNVFRRRPDE